MVTETFTAGQDFTVPPGVFSLDVELEAEAAGEDANGTQGGDGGRVVGTYDDVVPGDILFIRSSQGGFTDDPGAGGDSIDIRTSESDLNSRVVVAGGAGGGGATTSGGDGGADTGESAADFDTLSGGAGGTQTAGGAPNGSFGAGGDGSSNGGGGGGGWYGGGGGETDGISGTGGGGGSNYDDGLVSVTANERGTSARTHGEGGLVTITYEQTSGAENLQITNTTATSNTLAWDAPTLPPEVDSIDQYRVYRATDPGTVRADYSEVGTTPTPGFEDTGLDNGTEYHYRIGADLVVN